MATISTYSTHNLDFGTTFIESGVATVASSDTVVLTGLPRDHKHWQLSVQMFDVSGVQIDEGAGGSFAILVTTWCNGLPEAPTTASIDAMAPETVSWDWNTTGISVVGSTLTDTITWKVRLVATRG